MKRTNWDDYDYSHSRANQFFLNQVLKGYNRLLSKAGLKKGISLLELGSGTGYNSFRLAKKYDASRVVLVDSNDKALASGKKHFGGQFNVKVVKADVLTVNLEERFDLVHSQGLIEHFQGKALVKVINKHLALVKKGGYLVLFYPTKQGLYSFIRRLAELTNNWIFSDEVPLSKPEVMKIIDNKASLVDSTLMMPYFLTEEGLILKKN
ncbi:MAG: class I SAM-dependent methyltransferase [Candidatus Nanoarchaeia archaeon]|jgi:cyclopropane fatty-acyl-phospholipid synthase-like methyltransferase